MAEPQQNPVIRIAPHVEGVIDAAPPHEFEYSIFCRGAEELNVAVFQVSDTVPPRWTSRTGFTRVSFSNRDTVTFKGTLLGDRDRLVAKTPDEKHEDVTEGVTFKWTSGALERVRRVLAPWRYGLNVERGKTLWDGRLTDDVLRSYAAAGVTHLRFFPPTGRGSFMDPGDIRLWLDACRRTVAAGMGAHLDLMDYVGIEHMNEGAVNYVRACAKIIAAEGPDPAKFIVGSTNEWAGGDNALYAAWITRHADVLHEELPRHVVVVNGAWWGAPDRLMAGGFPVRADKPEIIQWHLYEDNAASQAAAEGWQSRLDDWARRNSVVTYCGEWGVGPPDNSNGAANKYSAFPIHILNAARGMGQQRPTHWVVTDGGWWRLNEDNSARLRPEVAAALKDASDHVAAQQWYQAALP